MPLDFIRGSIEYGLPPWFPEPWRLLKVTSALGALGLVKWYSSGARNTTERNMYGRVVMVTGGTSGIGAEVVLDLAARGAQIILLTQLPPTDLFLVEYIDDLRAKTNNDLIYAEQVDLSSLHSIRQFATKWIDNAPPRRLDMIILCAATLTPPGKKRTETLEGVETTWMVNYLANFHLLGILSPAIRAQPFDRDIRILMTTCSSYISSPPLKDAHVALDKKGWSAGSAYGSSKLALMTFGQAFQKHLDAYKRPDQLPMTARVVFVDPGFSRTPGMRRWLTRGSLWGLLFYLLTYFISWLFLKSPTMGAQSVLYAAMSEGLGRGGGARLIKECMEVDFARKDVKDEEVAKKLWESTDKLIEKVEKQAAQKRAQQKQEEEQRDKEAKEAGKVKEVEDLVNTIKKGKQKEAQKAKSRKNVQFGGRAVP